MFEGHLQAGDRRLDFGDRTHIMGVINLSPESKNPHTVARSPERALRLAQRYRSWGAGIIDIGGQSSHYENPTIDPAEEEDRVISTIELLAREGFVVSIDTWKSSVARAAVAAGAHIINDTGGLRDPAMRQVVEETEAAVVAVHVDGENPHAVGEVELGSDKAERTARGFAELLAQLGPSTSQRVILDPGIAVNYRGDYQAYTRLQLQVIRSSRHFAPLGRPLLVPIPRKRDIHRVAAYIALALEYGADMIRVHDVAIAASLVGLWGRAP